APRRRPRAGGRNRPHRAALRSSRTSPIQVIPTMLGSAPEVSMRHAPLLVVVWSLALPAGAAEPRARDLGIPFDFGSPGRWNAITDVAGVEVGHVTLVEGDSVRTGVTA